MFLRLFLLFIITFILDKKKNTLPSVLRATVPYITPRIVSISFVFRVASVKLLPTLTRF